MKRSQALSIVAVLACSSLTACSHQQTVNTDPEKSTSVQRRLVAENEYKQQQQILDTREMARLESQRLQREQATARQQTPD